MRTLPLKLGLSTVAILVILIAGCAPAPPLISGRDITAEQVNLLKSKKLTKKELLGLLGPPYAIFISGETANVPRGAEWNASGGITLTRYEGVDSSSAFALFPETSDRPTDNRVYYYFHSKSSKYAVFLGLAFHEKIKKRTEELYVLVNERKGVISDMFYLDSKGSDTK